MSIVSGPCFLEYNKRVNISASNGFWSVKSIGGVSGQNKIFNDFISPSYILSGTFYRIEKAFVIVEI